MKKIIYIHSVILDLMNCHFSATRRKAFAHLPDVTMVNNWTCYPELDISIGLSVFVLQIGQFSQFAVPRGFRSMNLSLSWLFVEAWLVTPNLSLIRRYIQFVIVIHCVHSLCLPSSYNYKHTSKYNYIITIITLSLFQASICHELKTIYISVYQVMS